MSSLFINPFTRPLDTLGNIMPFGKLSFYDSGTLNEADVYDEDGDVLDQPVLADITGLFPNVYMDDSTLYRVRLENAAGVEQGDADPWTGLLSSGISFIQAGTGAVQRTAQAKMRDILHAADFGVVGDASTNNTSALNAAIAAAIAARRTLVLPYGEIRYSTALSFPDTECALHIRGEGRPHSFPETSPAISGDPNFVTGSQLTYTGNTGDAFGWTITGQKRVYLTLENLTIKGKASGASGHGVHLTCANALGGFLVCYRDVTVYACKQAGIFHSGNVYECLLENVRSNLNGTYGFHANSNTGGIPGETTIVRSTFNSNLDQGVRLEGGGTFEYLGLTCTTNLNEGLYASSVNLAGVGLTLEQNSQSSLAGNQSYIMANSPQFTRTTMTVRSGSTGKGLFLSAGEAATIIGFNSDSSNSGSGYKDIYVSDTTRTATVRGYKPDDATMRVYLGSLGGHIFQNGQQWFTGQAHGQIVYPLAANGTVTPDATAGDSFVINLSASAATVTIANPTRNNSYHGGQVIDIEVYNATAGAVTITWGSDFVKEAYTEPATTKRKVVQFRWNDTALKWVQTSKGTADM